VYGEEKSILFWADQSGQGRIKVAVSEDEPNEPTKKGPLSFVLFESPFISVSRVSKSHPSLVSLGFTVYNCS
jgi:hypothetical protein